MMDDSVGGEVSPVKSTMASVYKICRLSVLLLLSLLSNPASGGLVHPYSWQQTSDDGRFVLVMVSPLPVEEDVGGRQGSDAEEIRSIRAAYSVSGLYSNNETNTPLWTLPYHTPGHTVFIDPAGKHLIIADDDWFQSYGHVVTFYASGKKLASHELAELLPFVEIRFLVPNCRGIHFDPDTMTFATSTSQGDTFVFDVTTGTIIQRSSMFSTGVLIILASTLIGIVTMSVWFVRRRRLAESIWP